MAPGSLAQSTVIVFSPNPEQTTFDLMEEQPVGTAAAILDAYYLSPFFEVMVDGVFSLDDSQADSRNFTVESVPSAENGVTFGIVRTASVFDRDADGAQTLFTLTVSYSTPDGSLSSDAEVKLFGTSTWLGPAEQRLAQGGRGS